MSLKGNQGSLHEAVKDFFNIAEAKEYAGVKYNFLEEIDKGHGRVETRRYWITSHLETIPKTENWKGLTSIGMVERICWINGKETQEKRYFICSIPNNVKLFAKAVREHWGIENKLHWRLDVIFREDANKIRKGNSPTIMTSIRHICMGIFDLDTTTSGSLAKKRRKAIWSDDYRAKLVFGL